jgi:hypothetical protein
MQVDAAAKQLEALKEAGREDEAAANTALVTRLHKKLLEVHASHSAAAAEEKIAVDCAAAEYARFQDLDQRSARLKMMGVSMAAEIDQLKVVRNLQVIHFFFSSFF